MAKYIGRQINIGLGLEWTRWTAVGIQNWMPKTDLSFQETNETIQDESSIGTIVDSRDSFVSQRWAEGDMSSNVEANSIGYLLYGLLGSVTSAEASIGAYTHDFSLNETNQGKTLTIGTNEPWEDDYQFALGTVSSMTISAEQGEQATFDVTFMAKPWETTTHTVSYDVDHKLLSRHSVFKTAVSTAGLGASNAVCLQSFEITFERNVSEEFCLGSNDVNDYTNNQFAIEGSFTLRYENEDYKNYVLDGAERAIRFELIDTEKTIGESDNPSLRIDLPFASMTEFDKTQGNDEVVEQTITFKGMYDQDVDSAVDITLTNTVDEYVDGTV